jgi:hypothetical protein
MKAGIVYDITFAVADRCAGNALVPKASLAMFALEVSPNAEQVDDSIGPADDGGFGSVHIRCHDRGAVSARLYDTDNPDDSADLLINSNGMGRPSCATP